MAILRTQPFREEDYPTPPSKTNIEYLSMVLTHWLNSDNRKEQLLGEDYYLGKHDILNKQRVVIGEGGELQEVENLPNNCIVDNVYAKLVNQKTNFVLGKPLTIATDNDEYLEALTKWFGRKIRRKLRMLGQDAINGGIAYLYPYYNNHGELDIQVFPAYEVCPIWLDKAHTELGMALRYYIEERFNDEGSLIEIQHVDLYTTNGVMHFIRNGEGGELTPDRKNEYESYITVGDRGYNWERLPIIPFKYNADEIPLIRRVKGIQDAFNEVLSKTKDNTDEDPRTSILVLKNYDGTNLAEFRQNLATYGVVKVTTVDGVQGGIDVLKVDQDATMYEAQVQQLKKSLIENGYGFDAKEERLDGDPNEMNISSAYVDIDLDANAMEMEFQAGFDELIWFIDQYLKDKTGNDWSDTPCDLIFSRDIFINEDAKIDSVVKSQGVISQRTNLSRHPWVTNLDKELKQLEEDKKAELEEMEANFRVQNIVKNQSNAEKGGGSQ